MSENIEMRDAAKEKQQLTGFNPKIVAICRTMTAIGAVMLAAMMFLSVADIIGRNLPYVNKPIEGTYEVVSLMVVMVGVLGLGYTQLVKGNIMIDIFTKRLPKLGQSIMNIISYIISIIVCVLVAWQVFLRMWDYIHRTYGGETIELGILLWPFIGLMGVGFAWVTVIFCLDLTNEIRKVIKR